MRNIIIGAFAVLAFFLSPVASAQCDSDFPGVYPAVAACPNGGTRPTACVMACKNGYEASWNNDVKPKIEDKCGWEDLRTWTERLKAAAEDLRTELEYELIRLEIACYSNEVYCGWAATVRVQIDVLNDLINSLQNSIDDYSTWINDLIGDIYTAKALNDQWYVDSMADCCPN